MKNVFSKINDFLNRNYYVNNTLRGQIEVVHLDDFQSGMLWNIDWSISQATSNKNRNFVSSFRLLFVSENLQTEEFDLWQY